MIKEEEQKEPLEDRDDLQESQPREERNFSFFRFEDLRLYEKVLTYIEWVNETTRLFPELDNDGLAAKFRNASQAIAIGIAEGSGRTKSQFIYHLKLSKSSIRECVVLTTIAHRFGYIGDEALEDSRGQLIELSKMMGALISSLQRSNNGSPTGNNGNHNSSYSAQQGNNNEKY
ncbi:MAG: four helix bundle protein [Bacteroidales bacterium]